MGFPSLGSWVTYGLGTENQNLPAFVVIYDARGGPFGGPANWSAGYMPAAFQGVTFRASGDPIVDLRPPSSISPEEQRARLDLLAKLNDLDLRRYPASSELAARIASYELAYRMQGCAPEAVDWTKEPEPVQKLYGLDDPVTAPFGKQCLMARRLVERGVRFVQLYHGGLGQQDFDTWDAHRNVKENHTQHAAEVDRPMAGLLEDLRKTGLLDTTLVTVVRLLERRPRERAVAADLGQRPFRPAILHHARTQVARVELHELQDPVARDRDRRGRARERIGQRPLEDVPGHPARSG